MTELADTELVASCLEGRKEAFEELVRRHQNSVFALAMTLTRNREDAADMAQDAFIRAYQKLEQYKPQYAFRNWVMGICANQTKNRFRSRVRRRKAEESHLSSWGQPEPPRSERRDDLEEAITQIPETLRAPLVLKHVEGLSYDEISAVLHIGVSAAKMRVKRGRDELVRLLNPAGGDSRDEA